MKLEEKKLKIDIDQTPASHPSFSLGWFLGRVIRFLQEVKCWLFERISSLFHHHIKIPDSSRLGNRLAVCLYWKCLRSQFLLPSQIIPELKAGLADVELSKEVFDALAMHISRITNGIIDGENKERLTVGYSESFEAGTKVYIDMGKPPIPLPFSGIVELVREGETRYAKVTIDRNTLLGKGSYTSVSLGNLLTIRLELPFHSRQREVTLQDKAIRTLLNKEDADAISQEELQIHQAFFALDPDHVASPPKFFLSPQNPQLKGLGAESSQELYERDLWTFLGEGDEPLLNALIDFFQVFVLSEEKGLVHNDVKPGNLLFKDGRVFLSDFGLSSEIRGKCSLSDYIYWDQLRRKGVSFPSTDRYGFVIALCELFIPRASPYLLRLEREKAEKALSPQSKNPVKVNEAEELEITAIQELMNQYYTSIGEVNPRSSATTSSLREWRQELKRLEEKIFLQDLSQLDSEKKELFLKAEREFFIRSCIVGWLHKVLRDSVSMNHSFHVRYTQESFNRLSKKEREEAIHSIEEEVGALTTKQLRKELLRLQQELSSR